MRRPRTPIFNSYLRTSGSHETSHSRVSRISTYINSSPATHSLTIRENPTTQTPKNLDLHGLRIRHLCILLGTAHSITSHPSASMMPGIFPARVYIKRNNCAVFCKVVFRVNRVFYTATFSATNSLSGLNIVAPMGYQVRT